MKEKSKLTKDTDKVIQAFQKGGIVIFPTDTVWGVGCIFNNPQAIKRLYEIKKRDAGKPTSLLIGQKKWVDDLADSVSSEVQEMVDRYWPGGLTLIFKANKNAPKTILGAGRTVGIRMPNHPKLLEIINKVGHPILGPSANFSGERPPNSVQDLDPDLIEKVDIVLEGEVGQGMGSTIVDVTNKPFKILREGVVKVEINN